MMKASNDTARRLYVRRSVTHVCLGGKIFGSTTSVVRADLPVTTQPMPSNGGKARIQVTQKVPHKKTVVEVWSTVKF